MQLGDQVEGSNLYIHGLEYVFLQISETLKTLYNDGYSICVGCSQVSSDHGRCHSIEVCRKGSVSLLIEPEHDKANAITCASSEESDQPGYPSSLIKVFAVHTKTFWVLSYMYP